MITVFLEFPFVAPSARLPDDSSRGLRRTKSAPLILSLSKDDSHHRWQPAQAGDHGECTSRRSAAVVGLWCDAMRRFAE